MFGVRVDGARGDVARVVPHACATEGCGYIIRVMNSSKRHIACNITVDGENALLQDGSLIVAPGATRELPGYLVSKNFVGKRYVKEYRAFRFGRPKVIEFDDKACPSMYNESYTTYGTILAKVFEAVVDEVIDSDTELEGQQSFFRGAGLNGGVEERRVPEGKTKHFLYSSVTVQGPRRSLANSTKGRWWVRGSRLLDTLEVRYREPHSLMVLGVSAEAVGIVRPKEERPKMEPCCKKEEKYEHMQSKSEMHAMVEMCDLTHDDVEDAIWSVFPAPAMAIPI